MKIPWENRLPYAILALLVLAVFYGVYFAKVLAQKRRGIQTRQIGRRKEKSIHTVEVLMSIATLGAPIAQLLSIAFGWSHLPANARFTGFCVGMLGDAIFLLSVLCMKDSWRAGIPDKDETELVTTGIYRFSRNPAFLGFDLMYVGVLLLYGNLLTLGFSAFAIVMLHLQILQEERYTDADFCKEHPTIAFDTLSSLGKYEVIAAFKFNTNRETFKYNEYTLMDEAQFAEFMENVHARQLYDTGVTAEYGDQLLTLSTCEYTYPNGRFVVVAKKA